MDYNSLHIELILTEKTSFEHYHAFFANIYQKKRNLGVVSPIFLSYTPNFRFLWLVRLRPSYGVYKPPLLLSLSLRLTWPQQGTSSRHIFLPPPHKSPYINLPYSCSLQVTLYNPTLFLSLSDWPGCSRGRGPGRGVGALRPAGIIATPPPPHTHTQVTLYKPTLFLSLIDWPGRSRGRGPGRGVGALRPAGPRRPGAEPGGFPPGRPAPLPSNSHHRDGRGAAHLVLQGHGRHPRRARTHALPHQRWVGGSSEKRTSCFFGWLFLWPFFYEYFYHTGLRLLLPVFQKLQDMSLTVL